MEEKDDRHICPCCGKYIFEEYSSLDICDVCDWMDDALYEKDPTYKGGGSKMNLIEAREAFKNGIQVR